MRDFFAFYADRIAVSGPEECWLWTGARITAGYGHTHRDRVHVYAHRAAYECAHSEGAADGLVVRHRCDNPPCCNPRHLITGTAADNVADMWDRGRAHPVFGEDTSTAKMTEADVIMARALATDGYTISELIRLYPICFTAMAALIDGKTWTHLPGVVANRRRGTGGHPWTRQTVPNGVLDATSAGELKRRVLSGEVGRALAREYGVSPATVSAIKVGRLWSDV